MREAGNSSVMACSEPIFIKHKNYIVNLNALKNIKKHPAYEYEQQLSAAKQTQGCNLHLPD